MLTVQLEGRQSGEEKNTGDRQLRSVGLSYCQDEWMLREALDSPSSKDLHIHWCPTASTRTSLLQTMYPANSTDLILKPITLGSGEPRPISSPISTEKG